jgi:hypothetical protein
MLPLSFPISLEDHTNMFTILSWYNSMPMVASHVVGDRFYENMEDYFQSFVPDIDGVYFENFNETDGTITVDGHSEETGELLSTVVFKVQL